MPYPLTFFSGRSRSPTFVAVSLPATAPKSRSVLCLGRLTFMVNGKKQVEYIPKNWIEEVPKRVDAGCEFPNAVREVLMANAPLSVLATQRHR